ncbi:exocyst complex component EXO70H1-like [Chenopodium quinoa]|uniref:exocyst complex component EXO70H1-like n=1 Tax=Chenopodium quinoa TaxID=63459 RepID=UPI000B77B145|nr:exocyst complex component EXO70H1-like [Chenopodium quinoa]
MEETMEASMRVIMSWDYETSDICPNTSLFNHHSREEVLEFMRAVKDLHAALQYFSGASNFSYHYPSHKKIVSCQNLLRIAKKRLSTEFFSLLKANSKHHIAYYSVVEGGHSIFSSSDPSSGCNNNNNNNDLAVFTVSKNNYHEDSTTEEASTMADLKLIADCMMSAGFGKKCLKIYKLTRRSFVEDALLKLGARKLKKSQVQKLDWETIDAKMTKWLNSIKICVKIFSHEKNLCEHLFSACTLPSVTESCFSDVCKESVLILLRIPGKLAKHAKKSPDKIFKFLILYEGMSKNTSEIEKIFSSEFTSVVRSQLRSSIGRVTEAVKSMEADFEAHVYKDSSKGVVSEGGIHPLTKYEMNYMVNLSNHASALDKVLADYPVSLQSPLPESYFEGEKMSSPVALHFAWLILILLGKLDSKSELYKDASLSYLFLANNLQYVVTKVKSTKLYNVLGEKWVNKHSSKVVQYAANYERMGWGRVISSLPKDLTVEISLDKVKECFKRFNVDFEEEYRKQVEWVVQDSKLRDEMKNSIIRKVDARYRKMYDKYKVVLAKSREKGKIDSVVKFTPEDLENYLLDLLDGYEEDDVVSPSIERVEMTLHARKENPVLQRRSRRPLLLVRQHHH